MLVFTVPMAHFRGIPTFLRERHGIPVVFYDGDVPMSLPEFGGMDTGFNYYHGADPSEYDLVLSNSEGALGRLLELGARRAEAVLLGGRSRVLRPLPVEKEHDVFFYGYGDKFRREWMRELVGEPSRRDPRIDFALGGRDFQGDIGGARVLGDVPFNVFARAISAARINLNITRRAHATVDGSSTCRPFELAASGAAIVSNPHSGLERWFEPGEELVVVEDADAALEAYHGLLDDPARHGDGRPGAGARPRRAHVRAPGPPGAPPARARDGGDGVTRVIAVVPASTRRPPSRPSSRGSTRSTPGSTSSSSTTGPPTPRLPPRPPPARPSSVCRSTSGSAPRCRPASGTRSNATMTSRCGSTVTGSTTPLTCRSCSSRSRATRRTSSRARGSVTSTAATGRRSAGGSGSAGSRGSCRCSPDSG